jgi:hypothetical protein
MQKPGIILENEMDYTIVSALSRIDDGRAINETEIASFSGP